MVVILCEKQSAKDNFAKALGGVKGSFDGENYEIVSAAGHLYGFPQNPYELTPGKEEEYKEWTVENLPWDPDDFKWKITQNESGKRIIPGIRNSLTNASEVVIATDNDPSGEGDLLAWEILLALRVSCPITRMYFADESKTEIQKAFKDRKPVTKTNGTFLKANTRAKFDYLSMQFSRAAKLAAGTRGYYGAFSLRQGRLKSVMVYLIGERLEAIANYKKVPFFEVRFKDEKGNTFKRKEPERFAEKKDVNFLDYDPSTVVVDKVEEKRKQPGPLLDLAGLSSILASKGFDPKEVLETYQKMYQDQVVSYPRTEDKGITKEQYNELSAIAMQVADVVGIDRNLLTEFTPRARHIQKEAAHGANRPGENVPASLEDLESYGPSAVEIYTLVAKNSLAIFGSDYIYEHQEGHVADYPDFIGITNRPLDYGYKNIFDDTEEKEEEGEHGFGEEATPFIYEGCNPKPKKPTMKWLIGPTGMLSKYNVGTGATRTSIFNELKAPNRKTSSGKVWETKLVSMSKKGVLSLTDIGNMSYTLLKGCYIASPEVTEKLFSAMNDVEKGIKSSSEVIHSITPLMEHDMKIMFENAANLEERTRKEKITGTFEGEEISFSKKWGEHEFTDKEADALLNGETITFDGITGRLAKQKYKGRTFWGFKKDLSWCGHVFTEEEVEALNNGEEVHGRFYSEKKKDYFECSVKLVKGKIEPIFEQSDKLSWCGYTFTEEEAETLKKGGKVSGRFFSAKKNKYFECDVKLVKGKIKPMF